MEASRELEILRLICSNSAVPKQRIAQVIGISVGTLNNFLKGEKSPRSYNVNKIKEFLSLDKYHFGNGTACLTSDEWLDLANYIAYKLK